MNGLYKKIAELVIQLQAKRVIAEDTFAEPRDGFNANEDAVRLEREIAELKSMADEDAAMVATLMLVLEKLENSKHKSRHRSLVITLLEDAESRLLRELGD